MWSVTAGDPDCQVGGVLNLCEKWVAKSAWGILLKNHAISHLRLAPSVEGEGWGYSPFPLPHIFLACFSFHGFEYISDQGDVWGGDGGSQQENWKAFGFHPFCLSLEGKNLFSLLRKIHYNNENVNQNNNSYKLWRSCYALGTVFYVHHLV